MGKSTIKTLLSDWWSINNTEEAIDTLDYLQNKGFRFYFETILKAYNTTDKEEQKAIIIEGFDENEEDYEEDIQKAYNQLMNLQETWDELTEHKIISNRDELIKYTNRGWDYGRLTFLSRLCFDAGYISEKEAWTYIDNAYRQAMENFDSWESFAKSYIIGRGMWGGKESANVGIMSIAEQLLQKENSPWVTMSWK